VNAHLADFYPHPKMAYGGYLGNLLFYFVSAYGLALGYQKKPIPFIEWLKKRLTKILIPFIFFVAVLNIGDFQSFIWVLHHNLVPHSKEQLVAFFPVLWVLYLSFFPINRLSLKQLRIFFSGILIIVALLFFIKTRGMMPDKNLPTTGLFFLLTGLACFTTGLMAAKDPRPLWGNLGGKAKISFSFFLVLVPQILHHVLFKINPHLVILNIYFIILTVIGVFSLFNNLNLNISERSKTLLNDLAACSLAVYFVHFQFIEFFKTRSIPFPYNILSIIIFTFLFSFPLTKISMYLTTFILKKR
jgi:surface polysaccharide O-acyltransferase-like enzyme